VLMPSWSNRQRSMHCSTRYDTCSLLLANRSARRRLRERLPPRSTIGTQRAPQPTPSGISAGSSQGHTHGSKSPPRSSDRPAWSVRHAIAHSGINEAISVGSALAAKNNGTSSRVRRPGRVEYSSIDNGHVNFGVLDDIVTAADQILFESQGAMEHCADAGITPHHCDWSRPVDVVSGPRMWCMSRQPERRRKRSDDELRKQRKEMERQWHTLQDRRRGTPSRQRRRLQ